MHPTVTIVITNYNYGKYLERSIRSCLHQEMCAVEVVVVDDASTDDISSHVLTQLEKENINNLKIIRLDDNQGVAVASNVGIRAASGQYVVRVDADDFVASDFAYLLLRVLRSNPEAFGVACDYFMVDVFGQKEVRFNVDHHPVSCGIMYHKDRLIQLGLYHPEWRHREEEELRKRLGEEYKIIRIPVPLYRYMKHGDNKTEDSENMARFKRKLENDKAK